MTSFTNAEYKCPLCLEDFTTVKVAGTNALGGKRTDFHERPAGQSALKFLAQVCPHCGFGATDEVFEHFSLDESERRRVPTFTKEEFPINGSDRWERVAICGMAVGWNFRYLADAWTKASWACVEEGDVEAERYYRLKAAETFTACYMEFGAVEAWEKPVIAYIIGEHYRRAGMTQTAATWYDEAISMVNPDEARSAWIVKAAEQQKLHPREWFG